MENNIYNSMILTSRRRHFYLVRQSKRKVGACGVNNQASAVLAGNELPFVAFSLSLRSFEMREKGGNILVPGPDYMVNAIKLPNKAPRGSGESLQKYVTRRCTDGTQLLFCWSFLVTL
ncbi:hypothetical protein TNCV_1082051 [Trichonephila clavipes]|nr:hypothetical protein TNCV_1082051 [Trichonephila clavipes]